MLEHLYHVAPLHYVPQIIADNALYSQTVLASSGISPRAGAVRRDHMLGVDDYVHLSLQSRSPLLDDKLAKGYAHALIEFDRSAIMALPETAVLPYNTKAWASRSAFRPITDADQIARLLQGRRLGRYRSLEVLLKYGLSLEHAGQIIYWDETHRDGVMRATAFLERVPAIAHEVAPEMFAAAGIDIPMPAMTDIQAYFGECAAAGRVLPPPSLPFD